jgi:hypothetical protein
MWMKLNILVTDSYLRVIGPFLREALAAGWAQAESQVVLLLDLLLAGL